MVTPEELRCKIMNAILPYGILGQEYADWHTENDGECGLTVKIDGCQFDILIRLDTSGKPVLPF